MLKLDASSEAKAFRASFADWLAQREIPKPHSTSLADFVSAARAWQKELAAGGWVGVHWPQEFGGRGLSLVEEAVVQEELARVGSPQLLGLFGLSMVGPVLIAHGTEQQKRRFLPSILSAEEIWCQGFSEPGAGSDLANVSTRAEVAGDSFVVHGQKVWTSFAREAHWCFLLVRTAHDGPKHSGLSYLLVDMRSPGITVRPLRQMSGDSEFNEVFFDGVTVPRENIVGAVGDGWKIALSTLMYERVILTFSRHLQSEAALRQLLELPSAGEYSSELASLIARLCCIRALAYEHLLEYSRGKRPGPEGSMDKLIWSETFQDICSLGMRMLGEGILSGEDRSEIVHRYLYSRGRTIAAGTSEIQRNIIAERVLSLPRTVSAKPM